MSGGGRVIPKFNTKEDNNPFTTADEKYANNIHAREDKIQSLNNARNERQEKMKSKKTNDDFGDEALIPNPARLHAFETLYQQNPDHFKMPVIKRYNISLQGMDGNLVKTANVFEDILPDSKVAQNRMVALSERTNLHTYIRSILVKRGDGEEVALNDKKPELLNLLQYLKMLEINPYHHSRITNNHYKTIADNFIMFRSCYPIRLDKAKSRNILTCSSDSIGANVRVYSMTIFDELASLLNDTREETGIYKVVSDMWREILFYTYIREEILKRKICPHFPFLHAYYVADNTSIDFDKLKQIKKTINSMDHTGRFSNDVYRNSMFKSGVNKIITTDDGVTFNINIQNMPKDPEAVIKFPTRAFKNARLGSRTKLVYDGQEYDVNMRSNKCVVAVTEAPDINIVDWSTRAYVVDDGPGNTQVNSGSHSDITWKSILFQIYITVLTLISKNIVIRELKWEKNIYIKTLKDSGAVGFWRYNVRNIPFYVPNCKALIMFDSCYDQVQNGYVDNLSNFNFKIVGDFYGDIPATPSSTINFQYSGSRPDFEPRDVTNGPNAKSEIKEMYDSIFTTNVFDTAFKTYGGVSPSTEIKDLLDELSRSSDSIFGGGNVSTGVSDFNTNQVVVSNMIKVLLENFAFFLHNKVGDIIEQTDSAQLFESADNINSSKRGDLIGYDAGSGSGELWLWAIYIGANKNGTHNILIKHPISNQYESKSDVTINKLRRVYGNIPQKLQTDTRVGNEDELIETYDVRI